MEDFVYIKVFITAEVCSETAELLMISCQFMKNLQDNYYTEHL